MNPLVHLVVEQAGRTVRRRIATHVTEQTLPTVLRLARRHDRDAHLEHERGQILLAHHLHLALVARGLAPGLVEDPLVLGPLLLLFPPRQLAPAQQVLLLLLQLGLVLLQLLEIGHPVGDASAGLGHGEAEIAALVTEDQVLAGRLLLLLEYKE